VNWICGRGWKSCTTESKVDSGDKAYNWIKKNSKNNRNKE